MRGFEGFKRFKGLVWFLASVLGGVVPVCAQVPTGYVSVFFDRLPNRDATELRARAFAEQQLDAGEHLRFVVSGFAEGLLADRRGKTTDAIAEPQDLQLQFRTKRVQVTAGFARVVWGRLDELQPTDVINPLDVSRFFFEGRSEARLPVPLVHAKLYAGDKASVEAVFVPWFRRGRFDRLDESSSPFNIGPLIPFVDRRPARTTANAQGGARLNVTSGRVDWSVSTFRGFRPFGLYSAAGLLELSRVYPRFTMVGGDLETVSGPWVVRAEVAAFVKDAFQAANSPLVRTGDSLDAGGGVDRQAGSYRISGQVLVHRENYDDQAAAAELPRRRTDVSLIASADRSFARQRYEARLFSVYNPVSRAGFVRGILTATLHDNAALEGSLGWFGGNGVDTIGRFSDSDFAYLRLKYFF